MRILLFVLVLAFNEANANTTGGCAACTQIKNSDGTCSATGMKLCANGIVFNPVGIVKAAPSGVRVSPIGGGRIVDSAGNTIRLPVLTFMPVFRKASDTTIREAYTATITTTDSPPDSYDLRLEFYYVKSDTNKTILAVNGDTLVNGNSLSLVNDWPKAYSINTNANGAIDLLGFDGKVFLQGFTRKTNLKDTTVATLLPGAPGVGTGLTVTANFTLSSISTLN